MRTRTGNELEEILHYYSDRGNEISRIAWERRAEDRRGPVVLEELPGADWSNWSPFYFSSGQAFQSPAPRRYVLAEVRLRSDDMSTLKQAATDGLGVVALVVLY